MFGTQSARDDRSIPIQPATDFYGERRMPSLVADSKPQNSFEEAESLWLNEASYVLDCTTDQPVSVDLSTLTAIRSEQLNDLIRLHIKAKQKGRPIVLCGVQDEISQVFRITRLDRLFNISNATAEEHHNGDPVEPDAVSSA